MVVVGVQNLYQQLRQVFFLHSLLVISLIEGVQTEGVHSLRVPDTQGIYHVVAIAYDGHIAGNRAHALVALLYEMVLALLVYLHVHIAAELDDLGQLRTAQLEGIALFEPLVGHLYLEAVFDLLLEHTVAVADAAAVSRVAQACERIQEAGRQSSQTAVSKGGVRLLILDHVQIAAQLLQRFLYLVVIGQVNQVVAQGASHQELHGHIVHNLRILLLHLLLGSQPGVDDGVLGGQSHSVKNLLLRGFLNVAPVKGLYIVNHASLKELLVKGSLTHNGFLLISCIGPARRPREPKHAPHPGLRLPR